MATPLTGYIAGAAGANWLVSQTCKAQFDLMATAALKPLAEGGCGATLGLSDGYVSRYQAIREIVAIKGYSADTALEASVKDLTKNATITDEQWKALEDYCNTDLGYINIYKSNGHAYLANDLWLACGGTNNLDANYGCKVSDDLRRTGNVTKVTANGTKGAMSDEVTATWMLVSGSTFGFHWLGPDEKTFAFDTTFKFGDTTRSQMAYLGAYTYFVMAASANGQIPSSLGGWNTDWSSTRKESFENEAWKNPANGKSKYTEWLSGFQTENWKKHLEGVINGGSAKEKSQACAIMFNAPWLYGMERWA